MQITGISGVVQAAAGKEHSVARIGTGAVYGWGRNNNGQVGDGSTTQRTAPTQVSALANVTHVAAGATHTLAVTQSGALYAWGWNTSAQLGESPSLTQRATPAQVAGLPAITMVAGGEKHSAALDTTDAVWTWGLGSSGQLGNGSTSTTPQAAPSPISGPDLSWGVAAPTFTPAAGTYSTELSVVATSATPGATIRYTANGVEPTESDPIASPASPIAVTQLTTVKARAWRTGLNPSSVSTAIFTLQPTAPDVTPAGGVYTTAQTVAVSGPSNATVRYTVDGTDPSESSAEYATPFVIASSATVKARAFRPGWTPSAPTVVAYTIDEGPVTPTILPSGGTFNQPQTVMFSTNAGSVVRYTTDGSEPNEGSMTGISLAVSHTTTLKAKSFKTGYAPSATTTAVLAFNYGTVATPMASPPAGSYASPQSVSLTSDAGTTIRYTIDGSTPTSQSPVYGGAIVVSASLTLLARAFKPDWQASALLTAVYSIQTAKTPLPTIQPDGGNFIEPVQVRVASGSGDSVRYTMDGSIPDQTSPLYEAPFTVNGDTTITLRAFRAGIAPSDPVAAMFRFVTQTPELFAPRVSPAQMTLGPDEARPISAHDKIGRPVVVTSWQVADPEVAEIIEDDGFFIHALAPGETTITATTAGGVATGTLSVLSGPAPAGTAVWGIESPDETSRLTQMVEAVNDDGAGPDLYAVDVSDHHPLFGNSWVTTIRALTQDGVEIWRRYLPGAPRVVAAHDGGIYLVRWSVTKLDKLSGAEVWSFTTAPVYR